MGTKEYPAGEKVYSVFRIKICGVTSADDARVVASAGADAIGLNFYSGSPRRVSTDQAEEICSALPNDVSRVGVFVNSNPDTIQSMVQRLALDVVQLHGDEPPELLNELDETRVIRAFRCAAGLEPVADYLSACLNPPCAVLVDSYSPDAYGGTGERVDWALVRRQKRLLGDVPLVLAGGLTASNVHQAILSVRPTAVDCASGVESAPGKKDKTAVQDFVSSAQIAFNP